MQVDRVSRIPCFVLGVLVFGSLLACGGGDSGVPVQNEVADWLVDYFEQAEPGEKAFLVEATEFDWDSVYVVSVWSSRDHVNRTTGVEFFVDDLTRPLAADSNQWTMPRGYVAFFVLEGSPVGMVELPLPVSSPEGGAPLDPGNAVLTMSEDSPSFIRLEAGTG